MRPARLARGMLLLLALASTACVTDAALVDVTVSASAAGALYVDAREVGQIDGERVVPLSQGSHVFELRDGSRVVASTSVLVRLGEPVRVLLSARPSSTLTVPTDAATRGALLQQAWAEHAVDLRRCGLDEATPVDVSLNAAGVVTRVDVNAACATCVREVLLGEHFPALGDDLSFQATLAF